MKLARGRKATRHEDGESTNIQIRAAEEDARENARSVMSVQFQVPAGLRA